MNIKIAHLYYDLMNLYGESGNVKALKQTLEKQGIKVVVKFLTLDDELNFDEFDIVYIGSGTENNQKMVLNHLLKYKKNIEKAINDDKFFLCTGNSIELFGKTIIDSKDNEYKALDIFDYTSKQESFRMVDEVLFKCDFLKNYILGFQNQSGVIKSDGLNLFTVEKGIGSYPNSKKEGLHYHNFFGTYVIGPILIRNPEFLTFFVKSIILSKNKKFKFKKFNLKLEEKAYNNFMNRNYSEYLKINE